MAKANTSISSRWHRARVWACERSSWLETLVVDVEREVYQDGKFKAQMEAALITRADICESARTQSGSRDLYQESRIINLKLKLLFLLQRFWDFRCSSMSHTLNNLETNHEDLSRRPLLRSTPCISWPRS